jgi:pyridoxamine 5'-phosphate oxidase
MASLLIPPPEDPVRVAAQWLGEAEALGRRNANALALASVDAAGRPSARMVLLKELAPLGYVVFYTNYGSRKGEELLTTGRAAGVLYWHELGRQVRLEGPVVRSPDAESDAYFATRPLASQVNAWSSEQSRPLADPAALEERAAKVVVTKPAGGGLPRPAFWGGFRLWLDAVELWV